MATRIAIGLIVSAVIAIAAAYSTALVLAPAPAFVAQALAYGIGASMTGAFMLGATRDGTLSPWLAVVFVMVCVVVTGTFWWVLALPPHEGAGGALWLGLPRRTAMVLYGVGAVPMVLLPIAYTLAFDRSILPDDDAHEFHSAAPPTDPGHGTP